MSQFEESISRKGKDHMRLKHVGGAVIAILAIVGAASLAAPQEKQEKSEWTYPVVEGYSPAWPLPQAAVQPEKGRTYKVVVEVSKLGEQPTEPAPGLLHAARAYNVFAADGVPPKQMKIAIVMHGAAGYAAMNNETYRAKYNVDNPNAKLIAELKQAGAEIFLCGQTLHGLKFEESGMLPQVQLATSAMIVLVSYQNNGYALLAF